MPLHLVILAYFVVMLVVICGSAWYMERRRRSFAADSSDDSIFRCTKCSYVYTDDPDVDLSRCPQCGTSNEVFEFY
jgi:rubrerythrin